MSGKPLDKYNTLSVVRPVYKFMARNSHGCNVTTYKKLCFIHAYEVMILESGYGMYKLMYFLS